MLQNSDNIWSLTYQALQLLLSGSHQSLILEIIILNVLRHFLAKWKNWEKDSLELIIDSHLNVRSQLLELVKGCPEILFLLLFLFFCQFQLASNCLDRSFSNRHQVLT